MDLILDTHVLLWMLLADERLGQRRRLLLEDGSHQIYVSAVTALEIATKVRIGKLAEARHISGDFSSICRDYDYRELNVTPAHGLRAGRLDGTHKDPFDRLLAAQSLVEKMPLVTSDAAFKEFGVDCVW